VMFFLQVGTLAGWEDTYIGWITGSYQTSK